MYCLYSVLPWNDGKKLLAQWSSNKTWGKQRETSVLCDTLQTNTPWVTFCRGSTMFPGSSKHHNKVVFKTETLFAYTHSQGIVILNSFVTYFMRQQVGVCRKIPLLNMLYLRIFMLPVLIYIECGMWMAGALIYFPRGEGNHGALHGSVNFFVIRGRHCFGAISTSFKENGLRRWVIDLENDWHSVSVIFMRKQLVLPRK